MSKSHVGMGYSVCPICHTRHDEVVLMHTRFKETLDPQNFMGWALCPEHDAMSEEYLALVETSNPAAASRLTLDKANLTGQVMHMRRTVVKQVFNMDIPDDLPLLYVEVGVIDKIRAMNTTVEGESHE